MIRNERKALPARPGGMAGRDYLSRLVQRRRLAPRDGPRMLYGRAAALTVLRRMEQMERIGKWGGDRGVRFPRDHYQRIGAIGGRHPKKGASA